MKTKCKANSSKGFINNIEAWKSAVLVYCCFSLLNGACEGILLLYLFMKESCKLDFFVLFEGKIYFFLELVQLHVTL